MVLNNKHLLVVWPAIANNRFAFFSSLYDQWGTYTLITAGYGKRYYLEYDEPVFEGVKILRPWTLNYRIAGTWKFIGLKRILRSEKPDIILVADYPFKSTFDALEWAYENHVPCILYSAITRFPRTVEGGLFATPIGQRMLAHYRYEHSIERTLPLFDRVIVPSSTSLVHLEKRGVMTDKIQVIPNSIDVVAFSPKSTVTKENYKKKYGIPSNCPVVGFVGRMTAEKGVEQLAQIFSLVHQDIPECFFVIAGAGPLQNKVSKMIDQAGLSSRTNMLGYVHYNNLQEVYGLMDLFAFTSMPIPGNVDQDPKVVLEAMSSGLPIVMFDIDGGAGWHVTDPDHGIKVNIGDVEAFSVAIRSLLGQPQLRLSIGRRSRDYAVATVSPVVVSKKYAQLLGETSKQGARNA